MNALNKAVSIVGSQKALADQIGVVQSAVANWLRRGNIPAEHCLAIEKATGGQVTRQELRPDDAHRIWPDLGEPGSTQAATVQTPSTIATNVPVCTPDLNAALDDAGRAGLIQRRIAREQRRAIDRAKDAELATLKAAGKGA